MVISTKKLLLFLRSEVKCYTLFRKGSDIRIVSRDAVHEIINNYHDDVHHMYHGLNHYSQKEYIEHDNYTHGYR
jgi:hypothetical protein